ncbi:MAG: hypothetical protein JSR61_01265 [Proteobacteria bacterium]|nr:hypothetical protein [Pseudomonadota bacterium]
MPQSIATFANFICRFGDKRALIDYLVEIVAPAFTKDTYVRTYGDTTHFHFYEVKIVTVDEKSDPPVKALAGRFIKDTELTRYQVFDSRKGLVHDEQRMRSSPSAFFVLLLNNHRVIYYPETPHAPTLSEFRATAENFLRLRHKEFIEELYKSAKETRSSTPENQKILPQVTKKQLNEEHERPTLEIVPLTSAEGVRAFIERYATLKNINFRILKPNPDIDAGEIFSEFRELADELNGNRASVTIGNAKEGLNIEAAIDAVSEATESGNQDLSLNGVDHSGNTLKGTNEHFQISVPIDEAPATTGGLINRLYGAFIALASTGDITLPKITQDEVEKIRRAIGML